MKYRIISVGKIREKFYSQGVEEYLKRLRPYANIELVEGLEERVPPRAGAKEVEKILHKEGEKILAMIGEQEIVVILDIGGQQVRSEELAGKLQKWNLSGLSRVNMVIGGSHGLADTVKKRADCSLSFSKMTFPHQMAVLILAEQIYRAFKILRGEPYHK